MPAPDFLLRYCPAFLVGCAFGMVATISVHKYLRSKSNDIDPVVLTAVYSYAVKMNHQNIVRVLENGNTNTIHDYIYAFQNDHPNIMDYINSSLN